MITNESYKNKNSTIDTWYTPNIICPYCGYEDHDSWEHNNDLEDGPQVIFCGDCGEEFWCQMDIEVTYLTKKIEGTKND